MAQAYETSIQKLGLDYLDLYLVHWPGTNEAIMIDTWKGMEDLYKDNKVKTLELVILIQIILKHY